MAFKIVPLSALVFLAAAAPRQEAELENLARTLVEKRARVDGLAAELDLQRDALRDRARALSIQRADLERQITALSLELADVEGALQKHKAEIARKEADRASLRPLVLRQIGVVEEHVRRSLPFKTAERLSELRRLRRQLEQGELKPDLALARLWSAVEDEFRLTRENGLYRQSIDIDGAPVLADVARLGMVLFYYRTPDGRMGMAVPGSDGAWSFAPVQDPDGKKRLAALFDSLKKHVRQGYYELPNPFAGR